MGHAFRRVLLRELGDGVATAALRQGNRTAHRVQLARSQPPHVVRSPLRSDQERALCSRTLTLRHPGPANSPYGRSLTAMLSSGYRFSASSTRASAAVVRASIAQLEPAERDCSRVVTARRLFLRRQTHGREDVPLRVGESPAEKLDLSQRQQCIRFVRCLAFRPCQASANVSLRGCPACCAAAAYVSVSVVAG